MPSNQSNINIGVKYNVDQASVNSVKKSLQDLQNIKVKDFTGTEGQLIAIQQTAIKVEKALTDAFNPSLNTVNLEKFKNLLAESGRTIDSVFSDFSKAGTVGNEAFGQMAHSIMSTNTKLTQTKTLLTSMGQTMMNTVKWGVASSVMNTFTNSVRSAFDYVKALDSSLNDIRIVTKQSSDQMANFAVQANNSAQALGRSTMDYTKAALTFYQQGLSEADVQARTEATLKAQNITGAGEEMADYLTAVWNGYKVANEEAELYVDKLASVADSSASNMSQLAIAMSKVASSANSLGVPVDSLNAQIATIVATTRQAPESVGNALKTIYSRINDISTGAEDAQISLGNYSKKMLDVGISVLDANGNLRDTGDVIEQIGGKWAGLSREQQIYLARTMAGQRQYNNLIALFDNWSKYSDLVNVSMQAQGATAQKNAIYLESLGAKMEQLGAAGERVKDALISEDDLKRIVDFGTNATNIFANLVEGLGGGTNAILAFGSIIVNLFSNVIGKQIGNTINKAREMDASLKAMAQSAQATTAMQETDAYKEDPSFRKYADNMKQMQTIWSAMSKEQIKAQEQRFNNIRALENEAKGYRETAKAGQELANVLNNKLSGRDIDLSERNPGAKLKQSLEDVGVAAEVTQMQLDDLLEKDLDDEEYAILLDQVKKDIKELASMTGIEVDDKLFNAIKNDAELTTENIDLLQQYINKVKNAKVGAQTFKDLTLSAEQATNKVKTLADQAAQANKRAKTIYDAQAVTKFASGIGRVGTGIASVVNLFKTWNDQNISLGQKLTQTLTTATFLLPSIITGVKDVVKNFGAFKDSVSSVIIQLYNQAVAHGVVTNAKVVEAGATNSLTTAMAGLISVALPWIAIGAAVAVTAKLIYDAYNADAKAAQAAAQGAKQAKDAYDQTKQSLDELKTSLDNLNSAYDSINELTVGTQEWRDAVREVNDQVLELIRNYPQLASEVQNVNGVLQLSEEGQEKVLQLQQQAVDSAQRASIVAGQRSRDASITSQATNLTRSTGTNIRVDEQGDNSIGLTSESAIEIVTALDKVEKSFAQNGNLIDKNGEYTQDLIGQIANQTGQSQQLISSLLEDTQGVNNLRQAILENTAATKLQNETLAAQTMQGQDWYDNLSDLDKQLANTVGGVQYDQVLKAAQQTWYNTLVNDITRASDAQNQTWSNQVLQAVKQATGQNLTWDSNSIRGGGVNRQFVFNNQDDSGAEVTYNQDYIVSIMAAKDALEKFGASAQQATNVINTLSNSNLGEGLENAIKNIIAGNGADLSRGQLKDLQDFNFSDIFSQQQMQAIAKAMGTDLENLESQFDNTLNSLSNQFNQVLNQIPFSLRGNIQKLFDGKDLALDTQKQIANQFKQALISGGKQGYDQLLSFYEGIEDLDAFDELANQIDFSNITVNDFAEKLKQAGIQGQFTNQQLEAYIALKKQQAELLSPEQQYKKIHDIIDGLSRGDSIDEEQAKILKDAGIDVDAYFDKFADGSLRLKTSAQDFYEYANGISLNPLKEEIQSLTELTAKQSNFESSKYSSSNGGSFEQFSQSAATEYDDHGHAISVDTDKLEQQINFLSTITDLTEEEKLLMAEIESGEVNVKDRSEEIAEAVASHKKAWQDNSESIDGNLEKIGQLQQELYNTELDRPLDPDIDENKWENLADYLHEYADQLEGVDQHLLQDKQAAEEAAEEILRYDHALEEVAEHYDDWMKALSSGTIQEQAEAGEQLSNVYSDLLGLPYDNLLSPAFTQSTENLELMKAAANGTEGAYEQLMQAARQDIAAQVHLDDADFQNKFNDLYNSIQSFDTSFPNLQVGASLNDADFLNGLSDMVTAAGMTAQQATNYLASMGIDAEVVQNKTEGQEKKTVTNFTPEAISEPGEVDWFDIAPDGTMTQITIPTSVPGIRYNTQPIEINDTKQNVSHSLKVTSAHKSSGGGFKYKNASHGAGAKHPTSSGGGGGKKGGGGNKGKTPKKATKAKTVKAKLDKKEQTAKHDPYEQIDKRLERQNKLLTSLERKEKNLTGKERLKNLQAQNKSLEKQADLLDQRINKNRNVKEEGTSAYYAGQLRKLGAKFDKDGQLTDENALRKKILDKYDKRTKNITDTYKKVQKEYNNWITNVWNKMSGDQQEANKTLKEKKDQQLKNAEDKAKDALKDAEELYKNRETLIQNYKKALEEAEKDEQELIKMQEQLIDNKIAISQIKVNLSLDAGQLERDWLDFEKKFIKKIKDDDILGNALYNVKELQSYIDSGQVQAVNSQIAKVRSEIQNLEKNGQAEIYGGEIGREGKEEYEARLAEANERLQQLLKQQQQQLMDMQDLVDDLMDAYLDGLDQVKDDMDNVIDQYERVNDLVNHNVKLTQLLYGDKAYGTMEKYYNLQKANNERELATLRQQQGYWQERLNKEEVGSDAWKKAKENVDSITDDLNSKLEDMIENLSDQWQNRVDGIIDKLNNALTGGRGLDYVDEQWDAINNWDDTFLDPVESRMGIKEVQSLYQEAIDGLTGSPKQQQKINKLMNDQLKLLREKDNLTQYDLDRAKASLEVEKARLALEQSRDNKTKMRLRRDSQGNYTYQYVADEQKLTDLQSALDDAQANLYNMDKEHYKETLNDLYDTYKQYIQKMKDLNAEYQATQDEEQRARIQARIEMLTKAYTEYYDAVAGDAKFNKEQYLAFSTAMGMGLDPGQYTNEQLMTLVDTVVPQASSEIDKLRQNVAGQGGLLAVTKDTLAEIANATKDYDTDVNQMLASAGTSLDTIKNVTDQTGKLLDSTISKAANFVGYYQQVVGVSKEALQGVGEYLKVAQTILDATATADVLNNLANAYNVTQQSANAVGKVVQGADGTKSVTSNKNTLVNTNAETKEITGNKQERDMIKTYGDWVNSQSEVTLTPGEQEQVNLLNDLVDQQQTLNSYLSGKDRDNFNYEAISQNIVDQAKIYDQSYNQQIANMLKEVSSYIGHIDTVENLNQNVSIQATFPNVINHLEIEQAFNELVNIAAQNVARTGN